VCTGLKPPETGETRICIAIERQKINKLAEAGKWKMENARRQRKRRRQHSERDAAASAVVNDKRQKREKYFTTKLRKKFKATQHEPNRQ